jgi:hypothetical protein
MCQLLLGCHWPSVLYHLEKLPAVGPVMPSYDFLLKKELNYSMKNCVLSFKIKMLYQLFNQPM